MRTTQMSYSCYEVAKYNDWFVVCFTGCQLLWLVHMDLDVTVLHFI